LRFIAMTWIIFFHYLSTEEGTLVGNIVQHRPLDLFTVISGFATHLAYGNYKKDLGTPVQFLARRASRLVFTYYLTLNISFFLKLISLGTTAPSMGEVAFEYLNFILALFGLNAWVCPALLVAGQPQSGTVVQALCWPHNGPLWYIQSLLFCWASYPLLRGLISGPSSVFTNRGLTWLQIVGWYLVGLAPALLMLALGLYGSTWLFCKVFPVFMAPPFYIGVAICDLYKQEMVADAQEQGRGQGDGDQASIWGQVKRTWGCLLGEVVLVAWIGFQLVPYGHSESHVWALVFGVILLFLGISAAHGMGGFQMGLKWLLASDFVVMLGDASLCAFTFQFPVAKVYYWALRSWQEGGLAVEHSDSMGVKKNPYDMSQHWMAWYEFAPYIVGLYVLAIYFGKHVDEPVSAWVRDKLTNAVK